MKPKYNHPYHQHPEPLDEYEVRHILNSIQKHEDNKILIRSIPFLIVIGLGILFLLGR